jgi:CMP-N,N'-diacetyllegionaminic acid synthase
MKILCTICFKKKSIGLKNKNFKKINNEPLYKLTYNIATQVKFFTDIAIFTDKKIPKSKLKRNTIIINRPKKLSKNYTSKLDIIIHTLNKVEKIKKSKYDVIIDLDVTSPRRTVNDINKAYSIFKKNNSDNLFSVNISRKNPYFNMVEKVNGKINLVKKRKKLYSARQKIPKVYDMNASIYIWKRSSLLKKKIFTKNTSIFLMPFSRSIDIDNYTDFRINEFLIKKNVQ